MSYDSHSGSSKRVARKFEDGAVSVLDRSSDPSGMRFGKSRSLSIYLAGLAEHSTLENGEERELASDLRERLFMLKSYLVEKNCLGVDPLVKCGEAGRDDLCDLITGLRHYAEKYPVKGRRLNYFEDDKGAMLKYEFSFRYNEEDKPVSVSDLSDEFDGKVIGEVVRVCIPDMISACEIYSRGLDFCAKMESKVSKSRALREERSKVLSTISDYVSFRDRFFNANMRLVVSISGFGKYRFGGVGFEDRIQEANIAMLRALDLFEPERGYKFSTYSGWWIRQALTRAMHDMGRLIRIPVHAAESYAKVVVVRDILRKEGIFYPSPREIAARLEWDEVKVKDILGIPDDHVLSLDAELRGDGSDGDSSKTLGDMVADPKGVDAEEEVLRQELSGVLGKYVRRLPVMQRVVLAYRMGFDVDGLIDYGSELPDKKVTSDIIDKLEAVKLRKVASGEGAALTLQEVGDVFCFTRERARQIEEKALRTLKRSGLKQELSSDFFSPADSSVANKNRFRFESDDED
jgi:RNA polymerase primary sigma factor